MGIRPTDGVASINRDRRRIFVNNRWRTLIPLIALGTFMYDDDTYYADGYVSMAEPGCTGYAEDGSRLRWMAVPTEDGGSEYQCVSYSTQRNRTVTEIAVPEEPMAEAPPVAEPETVGVGPANEPAGASPPPAAPATGCELLIYSEANFKGLSAPVDENQSSLSEDGWQNEIASVQIKSGTWDFYSDEDYAGEMMRLSAGLLIPRPRPERSKHGPFMPPAPPSDERKDCACALERHCLPAPQGRGEFAFAVLWPYCSGCLAAFSTSLILREAAAQHLPPFLCAPPPASVAGCRSGLPASQLAARSSPSKTRATATPTATPTARDALRRS